MLSHHGFDRREINMAEIGTQSRAVPSSGDSSKAVSIIGAALFMSTWWGMCLAVPASWVAFPTTLTLASVFCARDIALLLGCRQLVPLDKRLTIQHLPARGRQLAAARVLVATVLVLTATLTQSIQWLAVIPVIYAVSSAATRDYPHLWVGPSWIRWLLKRFARQVFGRERGKLARQRFQPWLWIAAAFAVLGSGLSNDARSTIAAMTIPQLFGRDTDTLGVDSSSEPTTEDSATMTPSDSTTSHPPGITDVDQEGLGQPEPEGDNPSRAETCGSNDLTGLILEEESYRPIIEDAWHRLGAAVAGCIEHSVPLPWGGVAVYFKRDGYGRTALVSDSPDLPAAFVRTDRIGFLDRFISDGSLRAVSPLASTATADLQLFVLDRTCVLTVRTFGASIIELSTAGSASVIGLVAEIGGTITTITSSTDAVGNVIDLEIDLNGRDVRVVLRETDDVVVIDGPSIVVGRRIPRDAACPRAQAGQVFGRS